MTKLVSKVAPRIALALALGAALGASPALAQVAPPPATGVTLSAGAPSPQLAGTAVVFTAAGVGSSGYQYRFFTQAAGQTTFTLVQDWSAAATWTTPTTLAAGDYLVVVHVRTGTAGFDAQAWMTYTLSAPAATGVLLSVSAPSPQVAGTPVVFSAAGVGSTSYQYRFFYQAPGSATFTLAQDWSAAATWTMPATLAAGDYLVVVHVRTGNVGFDAQAWMQYSLVTAPATGVTLAAGATSPQPVGTAVTFTAAGVGSSGYQYQFWYQAPGSTAFTLAQDWSAVATWTMPTTLAAGDYLVVVHVRTGTAGFDAQAWTNFTLSALPGPTVATITPGTGTTAGGDVVTIAGTNFQAGVTVDFGGFSLGTVTAVTATSITVTTPPHAAGAVDVIITNPNNTSTVVLGGFTFVTPLLAPKILSITPSTDTAAGGSTVTIAGAGFGTGAAVTFGGAPGVVQGVALRTIIVTVPAHAAGVVDVTVTNTDGTSATLVGGFTYTPVAVVNPPPTVFSLSVSSGPDTGGTVLAVNGAGFLSGATVTFGGVAATVGSFTATSLVVTTPPHAAGFVDVKVTNPDGQSATLVGSYDYVGLTAPNILTLNIHGAPMAGGTLILIAGTGFQTGATVTFGTAAGINPVYDPVNKVISVTTPPGPGGAEAFVSVTVTNPDGQSSTILGFHYGPPPVATDFFVAADGTKTLNNGKAGQIIDIVGSQFSTQAGRGVQVLFSGPASGIGTLNAALSSPTLLSVGIPKLNPGTYTITVTNFDGQFSRPPGILTVIGP